MSEPFVYYSLELDRKPFEPLSNSALVTLLGEALEGSQASWQRLWEHGLRMVLRMVNHMEEKRVLRTLDKDEAIAVGNAAIGEALLSWIPKKGTYSTWVWVTVRQSILNADRELETEELTGDEEDGFYREEIDNILYSRIKDEIAKLPEQVRSFVALHYMNGWTQQEIAQVHGVTRQRVNQLISQGIDALREKFIAT